MMQFIIIRIIKYIIYGSLLNWVVELGWDVEGSWFKPLDGQNMGGVWKVGEGARTP